MGIEASLDFATLELLPLGVIVVNDQGEILYYNQREEQISGRRREEVVGRNFFRDVAPCTEVREFQGRFKDLMERGEDQIEFDFTFPFALGARQVRIHLHPFRKGEEYLCVIFVADVTERELLRERILQSQRFSELGSVAAKVAHNFNNLLTVVQMSAEAARERADPAVDRHLARVLQAVGDGTSLVNRCLEIAKPDLPPGPGRLDLNEALRMAVEFARSFADRASLDEGRAIRFRTDLVPGSLPVTGDGPELRDALLNLLRNAVDAIPGQGTVRILSSREAGGAVVEIIDDGVGMTLDVQRQLFTPMFTTKGERGTGLGLASVHSTLRRHGGSIQVTSAPGKGSRFRITLPEAT